MAEDDESSRHFQKTDAIADHGDTLPPGLKPASPQDNQKNGRLRFSRCTSHHDSSSSSGSSSSSSSSSSDITLPPPPDGGWGWVIVIASFMIHFIADGYAFSFGVLYTELLEYFQDSKGKTAWVGSLFVSVPLLTGPIASALTNKYGCRVVTICGASIASVGFILSTFANSTDMLCLTFGVISGFGLSMVYVPAVVIVAFYFEKKRAFATGLAVAGSGIGNFVFAPLIEILIELYTWRGAVLVMGAGMLQMIVCGALFRPLVSPALKRRRQRQRLLSERSSRSVLSSFRQSLNDLPRAQAKQTGGGGAGGGDTQGTHSVHSDPMTHSLVQFPTFINTKMSFITPNLIRDLKKNGKTLHEYLAENDLLETFYSAQSLTSSRQEAGIEGGVRHRENQEDGDGEGEDDGDPETGNLGDCSHTVVVVANSGLDRPLIKTVEESCDNCVDKTSDVIATEQTPLNGPCVQNPDIVMPPRHGHGVKGHSTVSTSERAFLKQMRPRFKKAEIQGQTLQPLSRKDIFYRGNLTKSGAFFQGRAVSCPDVFIRESSESDEEKGCIQKLKALSPLQISKEVKQIIYEMLDVSILQSVIFNYFCLSCMLLYLAYDVPYVYTVDKATSEMGTEERHASLLISVIGLTSTVGQIIIGYVGDQPRVDSLHLYNALTTIAGACTMLVPLLKTYTWMAVYCGAYGFFISANYSLTTIILVELLGMDRLTNSLGFVLLAEGIANVVGPPFAGWMSDVTGGYDLTFVSAGAVMALSGLMLFAIPCLRRRQRLASESTTDTDSDSTIEDPTGQSNLYVPSLGSLPVV